MMPDPQADAPQTHDPQTDITAFLADPATFGAPVAVIGTHISRIFLTPNRAYKLKRAVKLPYADFSTPEIRLATCEKEVALNAPHAPGLYLGTKRITRTGDGLEFDGPGPLADAVVEMVRFDEAHLFDRLARTGGLSPALMADTAAAIARFHAAAPVVRDRTGTENLAAVLDINRAGFATSDLFSGAAIARLDAAFRTALAGHAGALDRRGRAGLIRRCHGDLHLRNICLFNGRPTLFDCIDFNDQIATVDTLYDLAFLLMDLWHRGLHGLANLTANRYFDAAGEDADFALLPFLMAIRAAVRAHVSATMAMDAGPVAARLADTARAYFDMAAALLAPAPPRIFAIGGFSGTGKTTVAETLAPSLAPPPGARVVESDRTRKAMYHVAAETPLPDAAYAAEVSNRVYAALGARARALASAGAPVIVDAVFGTPARRADLETALAGLPFTGVWLSAAPGTLRARVAARVKGPSDAGLSVLETQLTRDPGPMGWTPFDADAAPDTVAGRILALP